MTNPAQRFARPEGRVSDPGFHGRSRSPAEATSGGSARAAYAGARVARRGRRQKAGTRPPPAGRWPAPGLLVVPQAPAPGWRRRYKTVSGTIAAIGQRRRRPRTVRLAAQQQREDHHERVDRSGARRRCRARRWPSSCCSARRRSRARARSADPGNTRASQRRQARRGTARRTAPAPSPDHAPKREGVVLPYGKRPHDEGRKCRGRARSIEGGTASCPRR